MAHPVPPTEHQHNGHAQHQAMAQRGVTRPQMAHDGDGGHHDMTREQRLAMLRQHHAQTRWVYYALAGLGVWLLVAPATFGYQSGAMTASDLASGALLLAFGLLSVNPLRPWALWGACLVGVWLQFAPLVFWAPDAVAYANDTLVGVLAIALSILIPGMPWMIMLMKHGPDVPPGWSYSPSSWPQRAIMIVLGFAGWVVSRYLAAYQLGYTHTVWDPFFGEGTRLVLTSRMSHAWPISDAGLGAFAYTFEFLMGWMGGASRWRTMPWMVLFFGLLVVPLGLTHIVLVISQPVVVGHWCTFCLVAAAIMLPMIPLTLDEVVAMVQFMVRKVRDEHAPFWRTFWAGDTVAGGGPDERSPHVEDGARAMWDAMVWGMTAPWTLTITTLLGVATVFVPLVFGAVGPAASLLQVVGLLVVTVSVVAMAEVARVVRYLNLVLAAVLAIAPWLLSGAGVGVRVAAVMLAAVIAGLSLPLGPVRQTYGGYDRYVR